MVIRLDGGWGHIQKATLASDLPKVLKLHCPLKSWVAFFKGADAWSHPRRTESDFGGQARSPMWWENAQEPLMHSDIDLE